MKGLIHATGIGCLCFAVIAAGLLFLPEKTAGQSTIQTRGPEPRTPTRARAPMVPIAAVDIDGPDKIPAGQLAMFPLSGMTLEDLTADPPRIELLCIPEPSGVFYGVYDFLGRRPAALLQSNQSGTFTIVLIDYQGRETKRKEVRVEGGPDPDPGPGPGPGPGPQPEPSDWAKWTKTTAERTIKSPNRGKEARAMSAAIKARVSKQAAGTYKTPAQFRADVKTGNVNALVALYNSQASGRSRALDWQINFNGVLESNIKKQIPNLDSIPLSEWGRLYGQIADGLNLVQ